MLLSSLEHWAKHGEDDSKKKTIICVLSKNIRNSEKNKSGDTSGSLTSISTIVPQKLLFVQDVSLSKWAEVINFILISNQQATDSVY